MANINMTPVGASFVMPATIISPRSGANPAATPNIIGIRISAVSGDMRFVMISAMNTKTIPYAVTVSDINGPRVPERVAALCAMDKCDCAQPKCWS